LVSFKCLFYVSGPLLEYIASLLTAASPARKKQLCARPTKQTIQSDEMTKNNNLDPSFTGFSQQEKYNFLFFFPSNQFCCSLSKKGVLKHGIRIDEEEQSLFAVGKIVSTLKPPASL
jgi:hypothetical protein